MNFRTLFIVVGQPAAGKTTFSRILANRKRAAHFDIDTTSETLVRAALLAANHDPDDRDSAYFKTRFREPIYQTLFALAKENLGHTDAVISGPFTKEFADPSWLSAIREGYGLSGPVTAIHTHCSPDLMERRMRERDNPRDRAKLDDWARYLSYYESVSRPRFPHLSVDTGNPKSVAAALATLCDAPPQADVDVL